MLQGHDITIMPSSGNFQGFPNASKEFECAYDKGIVEYVHNCCSTTSGSQLISRNPFQDPPCYMGLTCYADDVTTRSVSTENDVQQLAQLSAESGKLLGEVLQPQGYVLNPGKRESLLIPAGKK